MKPLAYFIAIAGYLWTVALGAIVGMASNSRGTGNACARACAESLAWLHNAGNIYFSLFAMLAAIVAVLYLAWRAIRDDRALTVRRRSYGIGAP